MYRTVLVFAILGLWSAGSYAGMNTEEDRKAIAERFFRGVYGGDPTVVMELAAEDVILSYPIFQEIFDTPAIRGRDAAFDFATGFNKRWTDAQITIHEAVAEGDRVVLVWSFRARNATAMAESESSDVIEASWGGITLFRFDEAGKIVAEIGEESDPGPIGRVGASDAPE